MWNDPQIHSQNVGQIIHNHTVISVHVLSMKINMNLNFFLPYQFHFDKFQGKIIQFLSFVTHFNDTKNDSNLFAGELDIIKY
jgi:hypothetical protein